MKKYCNKFNNKIFITPVAQKAYCYPLRHWHIMLHAFFCTKDIALHVTQRSQHFKTLCGRNSFKKSNTCFSKKLCDKNSWSGYKKLQLWICCYSTSFSLCLMGWFHYPSSSKTQEVAFPQPCTLIWLGTLQEHHSSEASPKTWALFLLPSLEKETELVNNRYCILILIVIEQCRRMK